VAVKKHNSQECQDIIHLLVEEIKKYRSNAETSAELDGFIRQLPAIGKFEDTYVPH
jgi:hypothetical protein